MYERPSSALEIQGHLRPSPRAADPGLRHVPASGGFTPVFRGFTALGRYGKPEEVAEAVAFLASPGATLNVDCGVGA